MKKSAISSIIALAALALIISCNRDKKESSEEAPFVETALAETDSVTLIKTYPGLLAANNKIDVVGRVDGILIRRYYAEGDYVKKGQLLMSIEPTKYQDAVRQAEASLKTAQSQLDYYSRQYAAMKQALESDAVSKMDVIQAEANMRQAEASVMNATADLSIARTNLSYCSVRAELSGYITSSSLNPGSYINGEGGSPVLATIVDNSSFSAVFEIEEQQYEDLLNIAGGLGNAAFRDMKLGFNSKLPHTYTANLNFENPSMNESTGTMMLKGLVDNPYNELKNGMYLTVDLPYGFNPRAVLIKDAAVSTDQLGNYLYVVNDSNKVVYRPVKLGETYRDTLRIVESGLNAGERYITRGLLNVRPGETVRY